MWAILLLIPLTIIVFFLIIKNGKNKNNGSSFDEKSSRDGYMADKPVNPRQSQIDRDKKLMKKIFIYGGGAMLVILIAGIIFALNPDISLSEKMETVQSIGSILQKVKKTAQKADKETDGFYKSYFIDQHGIKHDQNDYNFLRELKLYSDYNRKRYDVMLKDYETDWYIIDGYGDVIDIRNKEYIKIRDNNGNFCNLKIR